MTYSLSERIAQSQVKKGNTKNKVTFLALKQDIAEALDAGWPMKIIWDTLTEEGKISFSYKTFRLYTAKFIRQDSTSEPQENTTEDKKTSDAKNE